METLSFLHLLPSSFSHFAWGAVMIVHKEQSCSWHLFTIMHYSSFGGWSQHLLKGRLLTAIFKKAQNNKRKHVEVYNA